MGGGGNPLLPVCCTQLEQVNATGPAALQQPPTLRDSPMRRTSLHAAARVLPMGLAREGGMSSGFFCISFTTRASVK